MYSLDTDQTLMHTENYNRLTCTHQPFSFTLWLKSLESQAPTAAHKIHSVKIIPATAVVWAKQHSQTMAGHTFFGGQCRPRTISNTTLEVDNLFWKVEVYLWGPEKDSWLVKMWPYRPSHTFLQDQIVKGRRLKDWCMHDCMLAFSSVKKLP